MISVATASPAGTQALRHAPKPLNIFGSTFDPVVMSPTKAPASTTAKRRAERISHLVGSHVPTHHEKIATARTAGRIQANARIGHLGAFFGPARHVEI